MSKRRRRDRKEWLELLEACHRSGKSVAEVARGAGGGARTPSWGRWKTRGDGARGRRRARPRPEAAVRMLPVAIASVASATEEGRVEVRLGDASLRFPTGTAAEYVGALLLELKVLAC